MRNKTVKEFALRADLVKYSKQIGIVDCEIPDLYTTPHDGYLERSGTSRDRIGYEYKPNFKKHRLGETLYTDRAILVYLHRLKNIRKARETLVHELVHYRFAGKQHGQGYDKLVADIIYRGKTFPRKHIDMPNLGKPWNPFN